MKKRMIALVMAVLMLTALFAGCGSEAASGSSAGQSGTVSQPEQTPGQDAPDNEPTGEPAYFPLAETKSLSIWFPYPPFLTNYIDSVSQYLIYEEAAKRLNIEFEFTEVSIPAAKEAANIMVSTGDYTDISIGLFSNYNQTPAYCVDNDIIVDLTDYLADYAPNYTAVINGNENYRKQVSTDDGRQLLMYYIESQEGQMEGYGPVVRKDYLDALELDVPETYDDYYNVLKAFKTEYGATMWIPHMGCVDGSAFGSGFGVGIEYYADKYKPFYVVDGQVKMGYLEEGSYQYVELLHKYFEEGLLYQDFMADTDSYLYPTESLVADGTAGVFFNTSKNLDAYYNIVDTEGFELAPSFVPVQNKGDTLHFSAGLGVYAKIGSASAVHTTCEDIELAVRYLDWWYGEEGSLLANYGVEGETFNYVDGKIEFTELLTDNEAGLNVAMTLYTGATSGASFVYDNTKLPLMYTEMQMAAGTVWSSNTDCAYDLPAVALTQEETEEFNSYFGDIGTYLTENLVKFITGEKDLADYEAFQAELIAMGAEECVAIYQDAYERYMSR